MATLGKSSGKWYYEAHIDAEGGGTNWMSQGVQNGSESLESYVGDTFDGWGCMGQGRQYNSGAIETTVLYTAGDIIGIAVDLNNGYIWWAKNNVWYGDPGDSPNPATGVDPSYSNLSGTIYPAGSIYYGATDEVTGAFTAAQQTYSAPSGFTAWGD